MYHSYEPTAARRENARRNADEALRLQPDLPEGHLALGYSYYYGDRDYKRALTEFEIAKRELPNEADASRLSPLFSDVRANGLNPRPISKNRRLSIPRTQAFFLILASTTWLSAT